MGRGENGVVLSAVWFGVLGGDELSQRWVESVVLV